MQTLEKTSLAVLRMPVPGPRGEMSQALLQALVGGPGSGEMAAARELVTSRCASFAGGGTDLTTDEDFQLALFCAQEISYRGLEGVSDEWEWDPDLVGLRRALEATFMAHLEQAVAVPAMPEPDREAVCAALFELTGRPGGPQLSRFVARKATREQISEFLVHKSIYTLKEADPHSWVIPRLSGEAKAALIEIQADEYGGGHLPEMHSQLFAQTLHAAGLEANYGAYLDQAPAVTLALSTLMSTFGLNRSLRGAGVGHLAAFEMTSSIPNRLYSDGLARTGFDAEVRVYFDEHVTADAVHEQIAGRDLAGGLVVAEPELLPSVLFGAAACMHLDNKFAEHVMTAWESGVSSLRTRSAA